MVLKCTYIFSLGDDFLQFDPDSSVGSSSGSDRPGFQQNYIWLINYIETKAKGRQKKIDL
jgi:hypothetical protein